MRQGFAGISLVIRFSGVGLSRNSFTIGVGDGEKTSGAIAWRDMPRDYTRGIDLK